MKHRRNKLNYHRISVLVGVHYDILNELFKSLSWEQKNKILEYLFNFVRQQGTKVLNEKYTEGQLKEMSEDQKNDIIVFEGGQAVTRQFYQGRFGKSKINDNELLDKVDTMDKLVEAVKDDAISGS